MPADGGASPWRPAALRRLAGETFDVLVVGGGATGAAIARDAALRGLTVALCERGDFAGQTSSQSSGLIHGGLRYLQLGDFGLVFEGLSERRRLMTTAPHLCRPVEFVFPAYRHERPSLRELRLGVGLYNALGLWRPPVAGRRIAATELCRTAPLLRSAGLEGAQAYIDCQTDDARLVLENVLDAQAAGAVVASYLELRPPASTGRWRHMTAVDRLDGETFTIAAQAIVNATGPFSDGFTGDGHALRPTLGVHIVVDAARLPTDGRAFVIRSPRDGRIMFILPAGARTIVGTTDTDWPRESSRGSEARAPQPGDDIHAVGSDVDYLLEAANHACPAAALTGADVLATYAGLRPLLASTASSPSDTSREHEIWADRHGLVTVAGGKLTTMRRMAEAAVDRVVDLLHARGLEKAAGPCRTRTRPLPGAATSPPSLDGAHLDGDVRAHLLASFGCRAGDVLAVADENASLLQRLAPDLPFVRAEVVFAARHELALEVEDVLCRRVPLHRLAADQGLAAVADVAALMASELRWSAARRDASSDSYRGVVDKSRRWRAG